MFWGKLVNGTYHEILMSILFAQTEPLLINSTPGWHCHRFFFHLAPFFLHQLARCHSTVLEFGNMVVLEHIFSGGVISAIKVGLIFTLVAYPILAR